MSKITFLSTVVAIACVGAGLARADDGAPITRAQVIAEVHAARASGELYAMGAEDSGSFWLSQQPWRSTLTREQVRAELAAACSDGTCLALTEGEGVPRHHAAADANPPTRAVVGAEAQRERHGRVALPAGLYAGPSLGSGHDVDDRQTSLAG
jgi:hypothetical protein